MCEPGAESDLFELCRDEAIQSVSKALIGIDANTAPDDILRELTRNSYEIVKAKYKKHG